MSQNGLTSSWVYKAWGQVLFWRVDLHPLQLSASQGLCLPDNITADTEEK